MRLNGDKNDNRLICYFIIAQITRKLGVVYNFQRFQLMWAGILVGRQQQIFSTEDLSMTTYLCREIVECVEPFLWQKDNEDISSRYNSFSFLEEIYGSARRVLREVNTS